MVAAVQYDFQKEVKYVTAPPRVIADTEAQETRKIVVDFAIPRRNPTPPRVPPFPLLLLVLSVLRRKCWRRGTHAARASAVLYTLPAAIAPPQLPYVHLYTIDSSNTSR